MIAWRKHRLTGIEFANYRLLLPHFLYTKRAQACNLLLNAFTQAAVLASNARVSKPNSTTRQFFNYATMHKARCHVITCKNADSKSDCMKQFFPLKEQPQYCPKRASPTTYTATLEASLLLMRTLKTLSGQATGPW